MTLITESLASFISMPVGHPIVCNVIPPSLEFKNPQSGVKLLTPVPFTDGRGIKMQGRISAINLIVDFGGGEIAMLSPDNVCLDGPSMPCHKAYAPPPPLLPPRKG